MKKKLPINPNPMIRTYTYHGFHQAIISSNNLVNEVVARLNVRDLKGYKWQKKRDDIEFLIDDNNIVTFIANKWNAGMNMTWWRECGECDEIEIEITEQLYCNVWGNLNLFLACENNPGTLVDEDYLVRAGRFNKMGLYVKLISQVETLSPAYKELPITLKLSRNGNRVIFYRKDENGDWSVLRAIENDAFQTDKLRIGFDLAFENSIYYEWTFSNYIQIYGDLNNPYMCIDYLWNSKKNWDVYTANCLMKYIVETVETVRAYGISPLDYVRRSIDLGRYIDMEINENIVNGVPDDPSPFFHQNLIYGYDDEEERLFIMNYVKGIPKLRFITYEDFESDRNYLNSDLSINVIQYDPDSSGYVFSGKKLRDHFVNYRHSVNTEVDCEGLGLDDSNHTFGIELLRGFCTETGLVRLTFDRRVSHLLYERSLLMQERLQYLFYRKYLSCEQYDETAQIAKESVRLAFVIRNLVLKFQIDNKRKFDRIKNLLEQFIENEILLCDKMICFLEEKSTLV